MTTQLDQARTSLQSGNTELALQQLLRLTTAEPANAEAFGLLAMASARAGKLAAAQTGIRRAMALDPQNADFCLTAANIEQDLGKFDVAVALLQQAV